MSEFLQVSPPAVSQATQDALEDMLSGAAAKAPIKGWLVPPQTMEGSLNVRFVPPSANVIARVYTTSAIVNGTQVYQELWWAEDGVNLDTSLNLQFASAEPVNWGLVEQELAAMSGPKSQYAAMRFSYLTPPAVLPPEPADLPVRRGYAVFVKDDASPWMEAGRLLRMATSAANTDLVDHWLLGPAYTAPSIATTVEIRVRPLSIGYTVADFFGSRDFPAQAAAPFGQGWRYVQAAYKRTSTFQGF